MNWLSFLQCRRQFLLYCLIGMTGATTDFFTYSALLKWGAMHYQSANAIGYACGGLVSFGLNARFNFKTGDFLLLRFALFWVAALLGWLSSAALLFLAIDHFGLNQYVAKIGTIFVVVVIQYEFNRRISFKRFGPLRDA